MDFDDTPQEAAFRAEARHWIKANAPVELEQELRNASVRVQTLKHTSVVAAAKAWQKKKADAGWACMHWPREYGGRDATPIERVIWQQEEGVYGKLGNAFLVSQGICGPALLEIATPEQKQRYLPGMASGKTVFCQLFSEPSGGSDLAGLRTRAERDGHAWVVNGQKIWTSGAHYADFGLLVARTDPAVPKHKGMTMFIVDMKAPGVEVRPIKQANGASEFNEVFFSDVQIADEKRIGTVGGGWSAILTTLMIERFAVQTGETTGFDEVFDFCAGYKTNGGAAIDDRAVRTKLANWAVKASGLKYTSYRAITALSRGKQPGPESSIGKLVGSNMLQEVAMFALDLQGASGLLTETDAAAASGKFQAMLTWAPALRLAGGTDEILRNILAERVLGLPPDIRVDKDVPFNRIPTGGRS